MARVPCHLADILTAAQTRLTDDAVVLPAQTFLSETPDDPPPGPAAPPLVGLSFAVIDRRMDTLHVEEEPGVPLTVEMELVATLWTQTLLDPQGEDTLALTHAALGQSVLLSKLVNALSNHELVSGANTLSWRPIIFLGVRNRGRWKKGEDGWRSLGFRFNINFELLVAT